MHDLRLAFRNLVRKPAFSVIAVLTLALGVGANAAVFTVSYALLLAPLPYERPGGVYGVAACAGDRRCGWRSGRRRAMSSGW